MASIDNVPDTVSPEPHQTTQASATETNPASEKETTTVAPQTSSSAATLPPEKSGAVVNESASRSDGAAAEESSVRPTETTITTTTPQTSADPETTTVTEGELSDQSKAAVKEAEDTGPSLVITLLLTTGARHPFKIDGKYLRKRGVNVENYDPFCMSVYTLKELIWREWRSGKISRRGYFIDHADSL